MKKSLLGLIVFLVCQSLWAGVFLEKLQGTDRIYRSRAPKATEMGALVNTGITSVLIFKNQIKTEVDEEIQQLTAAGISRRKIYNIPFLWKGIPSDEAACGQVIDALKILVRVQHSNSDKIVFHCSVGEDRTGLLAGLITQILQVENTEMSYENQMCAKGYAGGNPHKPKAVSAAVDKYLTPLYFEMSRMIEQGLISESKLDKKVCKQLAQESIPNFKTCS